MQHNIDMAELCNGALNEAVKAELDNVLANIRDPNYPAKDLRKITITMTFKPDDARSMSTVNIQTSSKLASVKPLDTTILLGRDDRGALTAVEHMPVNNDNLTIPMKFVGAGGQ